jgi:hypothetical protein
MAKLKKRDKRDHNPKIENTKSSVRQLGPPDKAKVGSGDYGE